MTETIFAIVTLRGDVRKCFDKGNLGCRLNKRGNTEKVIQCDRSTCNASDMDVINCVGPIVKEKLSGLSDVIRIKWLFHRRDK